MHAGVRKNTRNRQAPNRYGQQPPASPGTPATQDTHEPSSSPEEAEPSIPQYNHSLSSIDARLRPLSPDPNHRQATPVTPASPCEAYTSLHASASPDIPRSLTTMRELLRSHEQEIVDRVVQQLNTQNQSSRMPARVPHSPNHHLTQQYTLSFHRPTTPSVGSRSWKPS